MHTGSRCAFTLTELLIALFVVAVLIGILVPSLAGVREHARRIVCGSNQRQVGLGIHMYSDQWDSFLPSSVFLGNTSNIHGRTAENYRPQDMVTVRVLPTLDSAKPRSAIAPPETWDGLGLLFSGKYVTAPQIYYCPSHRGDFRFEEYEDQWHDAAGEIVSNYHYRGMGPNEMKRLHLIPQDAAIVSDSLRSFEELNHVGGFNVLHASLSVAWMPDEAGEISSILANQGDGGGDSDTADLLWGALDGEDPSDGQGTVGSGEG
ncbi:MAG: hypothetical protein DHS20C14_03290 [Phycisphaeraceae bacterium]|nr:MAG: hypothetical protein DHS20C14_03290 [Phycisphaeraceae bacterium]